MMSSDKKSNGHEKNRRMIYMDACVCSFHILILLGLIRCNCHYAAIVTVSPPETADCFI